LPLLGRSENLDEQPLFRLPDLLRYNLKTVAYLLKEAFQQLWEYNSPAWAGKLLEEWRPHAFSHRAHEEYRPASCVNTGN